MLYSYFIVTMSFIFSTSSFQSQNYL
ncbi:hypothetical protein PLD_01520 [Pseudomonas sp. LD120]|nr:hypothetical protein PLD_01520 [Pseudomonas sp. LD120]